MNHGIQLLKEYYDNCYLKYYKEILEDNQLIDDDNYCILKKMVEELWTMEEQCGNWYDSNGLVSELFEVK